MTRSPEARVGAHSGTEYIFENVPCVRAISDHMMNPPAAVLKQKAYMNQNQSESAESRSEPVDAMIEDLGDWRAVTLARVRALIKQADPDVIEEIKWRKPSNSMRGVPVWSHDGIICTGESYQDKVKLTFAKGASLDDPHGLFNASLEGSTRRAIDLGEGDEPDEEPLLALIRAAVALNEAGA